MSSSCTENRPKICVELGEFKLKQTPVIAQSFVQLGDQIGELLAGCAVKIELRRGNWIGAVSPRQAGAAKPASAKPEPVKTVEEKIDEAFDDDIGF